MTRRHPRAIALVIACGLTLASPARIHPHALSGESDSAAGVREFTVDDAWGRDTVEFRTTAPLEDIVGTTNQVTGKLKADPKNLAGASTTARFEVDLTGIRTGIDLRDGHVAKALGADKTPTAVLTLDRIKSASPAVLEPGVPADLSGEGTFQLKGASHKVDVKARVTYVPKGTPASQLRPGNLLKVVADFDVKLADYGVERKGAVLPLQVGETAHVTATLLASDATPEENKPYRDSAVKYLGKARK
ncbi:MAG TPA: YceI family protein [Thermoanaerobaculia bacterium]|nr:YceI family protein [Thermoanaerobaculia bacterium]